MVAPTLVPTTTAAGMCSLSRIAAASAVCPESEWIGSPGECYAEGPHSARPALAGSLSVALARRPGVTGEGLGPKVLPSRVVLPWE
jgi:hypothetical protein